MFMTRSVPASLPGAVIVHPGNNIIDINTIIVIFIMCVYVYMYVYAGPPGRDLALKVRGFPTT